ncbi:AIPR family protein [Halomonas maura]|uniref:AIPR family protein n=1 Tax=Halomonas maura TaxID=117606 RepID=UPI0025B50089|nr:AIPR family protein [Halomonas maura]MDN3558137.1 AIPR family protein [Halomonas maura]
MNPVVRAQLKAFGNAHPSKNLPENELFEVFSIFSISNGLLTDDIDPFSAHLEGSEFGIDGISLIIQGELCTNSDEVEGALSSGKNHTVEFNFFQSKTSEKLDYGEISKFFDATHDFFNNEFLSPSNQIIDLTAAKDTVYGSLLKKNPELRLFFVSTGSGDKSRQIKKLIEENKHKLLNLNIFSEVDIEVISAKDLQNGYRSATNSISEQIDIHKPITLPDHPSVQQAFLGFVSAEQLVRIATIASNDSSTRRINKAVFFDNIRDFNPNSPINKSILNEVKNGNRESFIFKNNGVTVVSKEINRKGDTFHLEDYQIVNGCQTSNILFLAEEHARDIYVPFRLIGSNDPEFVSSIIIGTNKQNEVKDDQFWALTSFMKDLEEYCREQSGDLQLFVERRENQYRGESIERTRVCRPSDLVKSVSAMFLFQPHRSARDYRGIRREFSNRIFQDSHSVVPYHTAAFAAYRTDFAIRNKRVPNDWSIYKYYFLSAIGKNLTGGNEVFIMNKRKQQEICKKIIDIFSDEVILTRRFQEVADTLDKILESNNIKTREKSRDFLRAETVTAQFDKIYHQ